MGKTGRLYSPEFKEEAVRLVRSSEERYPVAKIARDLDVSAETLRKWFFRESDEPRPGSRPSSKVSFQAAEVYSTRCLNKSNFPRPYIERLMNLSLFTRPSVCP